MFIINFRYAEEIQCISELRRTLKCVDLCKGDTFQLAVGQATGKVSLVNMTGGTKNFFGGDGCEYIPRQSHCCTAVSWHPSNYSFLAAGFEKLRYECMRKFYLFFCYLSNMSFFKKTK